MSPSANRPRVVSRGCLFNKTAYEVNNRAFIQRWLCKSSAHVPLPDTRASVRLCTTRVVPEPLDFRRRGSFLPVLVRPRDVIDGRGFDHELTPKGFTTSTPS